MSNTLRIAGTCYIKVDGTQLDVNGSVEVPLNLKVRESIMSPQGNSGYKETLRAPFVKLTANFTRDFPFKTLSENDNMTITAELANGSVYVLSQAWLEGEADINASDGTVSLEFRGKNGGFN